MIVCLNLIKLIKYHLFVKGGPLLFQCVFGGILAVISLHLMLLKGFWVQKIYFYCLLICVGCRTNSSTSEFLRHSRVLDLMIWWSYVLSPRFRVLIMRISLNQFAPAQNQFFVLLDLTKRIILHIIILELIELQRFILLLIIFDAFLATAYDFLIRNWFEEIIEVDLG
jgi:hypothetical protein